MEYNTGGIPNGIRSWDYKVFTDATWATENDRKSFQSYVVVRYGGATSWQATRQRSTSESSMEVEKHCRALEMDISRYRAKG